MENVNESMNSELITNVRFVSITGCIRDIPMTMGDIELLNANNAFDQFRNNIIVMSEEVGKVIDPDTPDEPKKDKVETKKGEENKEDEPKTPEELYKMYKEPLDGFGLEIDYDTILKDYDMTTKMLVVTHDLIHLFEVLIDAFDYSKTVNMLKTILPVPDINTSDNGLNKLSDIKIDPFDTTDDDDSDTTDDDTDEDYIPPMLGRSYGGSSDE